MGRSRNQKGLDNTCFRSCSRTFGAVCVIVLLVVITGVLKSMWLSNNEYYELKQKRFMMGGMASESSGKRHTFQQAAVATDNEQCSKIGRNILHHGGSAVDSAIASMLCLGVVHPHSTGIGGGGFMLVYHRFTRFSEMIDFRETAPLLASKDMFHGDLTKAIMGGLGVGVPGELKGMQKAWEKYGKLPWKKLFEPAIHIAEDGFNVSKSLEIALNVWKKQIMNDRSMREIFTVENRLYKAGELMKRPTYARTLRMLANTGNADSVYGGLFGQQMVKDINSHGGQFTDDDFKNYKVNFKETIKEKIGPYTLLTTPPPTSGPVLALVLNILRGYNFTKDDLENNTALTYHRIIEAFEMSYARRYKLADPDYENSVTKIVNEMTDPQYGENLRRKIHDNKTFPASYYEGENYDVPLKSGTTHLVVMAENGDTVSVTSTVNGFFGAKFRSPILGLIYNNEMDDFSAPGMVNEFGLKPAPVNYIQPGKRPQSSSAPVILLNDKGDVEFVAGASGGTVITTAVAQALINFIWFGKDLHDAISLPRLHHQLYPENLFAETQFPITVLHELEGFGHKINISDQSHGVVQGIARIREEATHDKRKHAVHGKQPHLIAESDFRKGGTPAGY